MQIKNLHLFDMAPVIAVGHGTMSHGTVTAPDFVSDVAPFIETYQGCIREVYRRARFRDINEPTLADCLVHAQRKLSRQPIKIIYDPCRLTVELITQPQQWSG